MNIRRYAKVEIFVLVCFLPGGGGVAGILGVFFLYIYIFIFT